MLFTIGHSNHKLSFFLELLKSQGVAVVVDVRSAPYSRYVPHFNKYEIDQKLKREGFQYIFMGDVIGGKPDDKSFYDASGRVQYNTLAGTKLFQKGLDRLERGLAGGWRIGLMCAEENPNKCHRHLLIAREMENKRKIPVWHIRADGTLLRANELLNMPKQIRLL